MTGLILGALAGAAVPVLVLIFVVAVNRFNSEVMFVLLPGAVLTIVAAIIGALVGWLMVWWAAPIVVSVGLTYWLWPREPESE